MIPKVSRRWLPLHVQGVCRWIARVPLFVLLVWIQSALAAERIPTEIDWNRARQLYEKSRNGEALTPDEKSYLEQAKAARQKAARGQSNDLSAPSAEGSEMKRARQLFEKQKEGQPLTPEEKSFLEKMQAAHAQSVGLSSANAPSKPTGLIPLDQMSAQENYKGEDGGLYGGGRNEPPAELMKSGQGALAKIVPLDDGGNRAPDGKIVLLTIGMSNTTQESSRFKELADHDPDKSPEVVIVDGAQGGKDAAAWSDEKAATWKTAEERLRAAGVTSQQVQIIWMKHARISPARFGEYPKHGEELKTHVIASLQIAKKRFPNLRVAYLSSRIYAGYASTQLNPEPYAYESGLVVRSIIRDQIKGEAALNWDPSKGEVKAPLLLWGPYLWADGTSPRKSDGLTWQREDLAGDGTHPSPSSGRDKVARLLLKFVKTDLTAKTWYLKPSAQP